jgi:hypothetical protein
MIRIRTARLLPLLAGLLLSAPPASLRAQAFGGSVGLAAPVGPLADGRGVGVRIQGSLHSPGGRLRADVAGLFLPGSEGDGLHATRTRDYRSVSLGANLLPVLVRSEALRVRGLIGLSGHGVTVPGTNNPYGIVPGAQLGGVLERTWKGHALTGEAGLHLIASDHGLGELEAALFVPVSIGIRW